MASATCTICIGFSPFFSSLLRQAFILLHWLLQVPSPPSQIFTHYIFELHIFLAATATHHLVFSVIILFAWHFLWATKHSTQRGLMALTLVRGSVPSGPHFAMLLLADHYHWPQSHSLIIKKATMRNYVLLLFICHHPHSLTNRKSEMMYFLSFTNHRHFLQTIADVQILCILITDYGRMEDWESWRKPCQKVGNPEMFNG